MVPFHSGRFQSRSFVTEREGGAQKHKKNKNGERIEPLNAACYTGFGGLLTETCLLTVLTMSWTNRSHLPLSVVSSSGSLSRRASGPGLGIWPSAWPPLLSPGSHSSPGSPVETRTNAHKHSTFAENRASSKGQPMHLQES